MPCLKLKHQHTLETMKTYQLKLAILLLCYSFGIQSSIAQQKNTQTSSVTEQQIDAVFENWKDSKKPGLAVSVIKDGQAVYK